MQTQMEWLMVIAFCAAIAVRLFHYIKRGVRASKEERLILATMGVGFVIGAVNSVFSKPGWEVVLYEMGAMLCYMGLVFSDMKVEKE